MSADTWSIENTKIDKSFNAYHLVITDDDGKPLFGYKIMEAGKECNKIEIKGKEVSIEQLKELFRNY